MTYRPSRVRVAMGAGFALFALWAALAAGTPLPVRVAGWALFLSAVPVTVIALRTWVTIADDGVEVGRVFGVKRFRSAQATVRQFAVPGGVARDGSAIHFEASDGQSATIALALFRPQDRLDLVRGARAALTGEQSL